MITSPYKTNYDGKPRKIGIEIEFSGLTLQEIAEIIVSEIGGNVHFNGKYECSIQDSSLSNYGDFKIELDASLLRDGKIGKYLNQVGIENPKYMDSIEDFLSKTASEVVPMEIVTPPIPLSEINKIENIREALRKHAAKDTHSSVLNAFGLHLNPEVPSKDASDIRDFLRSFIIMYEWLKDKLKVDTSRRLTPYIDPFPKKYAKLILNNDYNPDMSTLIDDYLSHNPTRNRPLDMLPFFTWMDEDRVLSVVDDGLTSSRPTFHYRLPNCEIANPEWSITKEWNHWVVVERIAHSKEKLHKLSDEYLNWVEKPAETFIRKIGHSLSDMFNNE